MPQVVEAKVFDAGALLCQAPGGGALLDAFSGEGEAPARVLSPRRSERRYGIRIQGNATTVARLRRTVIKPGHFSVKIHAAPFKPQDLAGTRARQPVENANSTIGFMRSGKASIKRSASSRLRNLTRRRGSFSIRIFGTPLSHRQS